MSALNLFLGVLPFLVIAVAALSIIPLYRQWLHPSRILSQVLNVATVLALAGLVLPLPGAVMITWWLLAAVAAVAAVLASRRALRDAPPRAPQPAEGRKLTRRERTQEKGIRPAPWWELAFNLVVLVVVLAVMLAGGH